MERGKVQISSKDLIEEGLAEREDDYDDVVLHNIPKDNDYFVVWMMWHPDTKKE